MTIIGIGELSGGQTTVQLSPRRRVKNSAAMAAMSTIAGCFNRLRPGVGAGKTRAAMVSDRCTLEHSPSHTALNATPSSENAFILLSAKEIPSGRKAAITSPLVATSSCPNTPPGLAMTTWAERYCGQ
jgi:hypothetical protein